MNLDYLSGNALTKYPFKDDSSLTNSVFTIPDDAILDMQAFLKDGAARCAISVIQWDPTTQSFVMGISTFGEEGNFATFSSITPVFLSDLVVYDFFVFDSDFVTAKIVIGPGFIPMFQSPDPFYHSFNGLEAELSPSCVIIAPPRLRSLTFSSLVNNVPTVTEEIFGPDDVTIKAGHNLDISESSDNGPTLSVIPGAGQGLLDDCEGLVIDDVRHINGIGPDTNGDFHIVTDNCFSSDLSHTTETTTYYFPSEPPEFYWTGLSNENHSGDYGEFVPGDYQGGDPRDYKFEVYLFYTTPKTIKGITVYQSNASGVYNGSEHWSTLDPNTVTNNQSWPLVIFNTGVTGVLGTQINNAYNDIIGTFHEYVHFTMFGQPRVPVNTYFTMKIIYLDDTFELRTTQAIAQTPAPSGNTEVQVDTQVINGLRFKHTCSPKCTEENVQAYAHYLNRVKEGMLTIGLYANAVRATLNNAIVEYKLKQQQLQRKFIPSLAAEHVITDTTTKNFLSFAVGVYDPRNTELSSTVTVAHSPQLTYVPGSSRLNSGNVLLQLPDQLGFQDKILSCKSSAIYEFVLQADKTSDVPPPTHPVKDLEVAMTLKHLDGSAYVFQPVLMDVPYFTVRYSTFKKLATTTLGVTIEMFDPQNRTMSTALNIGLTGYTLIPNTAQLNLNNTITGLPSIGVPGTSMNFAHRAAFSFEATTNSSGTFSLGISLINAGTYARGFQIIT